MKWLFKKPTAQQQKQQDYEKLGKQVAALYDHLNPDRAGLYRTAFLKGMVMGLGSVIGATLVITAIVWLLSIIGYVPFVKPLTDNVRESIQSSTP